MGHVVPRLAQNQIINLIQITIEGEDMAVWYFCRSHSVMSKYFDFTEVLIGPMHVARG